MNKTITLKLITSIWFLFLFSITIHSQNFDTNLNLEDSTQTHVIILKDGTRLKGHISEIQNNEIFFFSKKNQKDTTLLLSQIHKIKVLGHLDVNSKKYSTPFQYNQYVFFSNTAFGIKKKERNYRTFLGASMLFDYGVTDEFSIGTPYTFPFLFSINIKITGELSSNSRMGFKSLYLALPTLVNDDEQFWVFENTVMTTFGSPDRFFNIAASNYWTKTDQFSDFFDNGVPRFFNSISFGGGYRLNERWQFIIENQINFNLNFIDAKVLPNVGISYATPKFNVAAGFQSPNRFGYSLFPIMDISEDSFFTSEPQFLSKIPYFTYSKIF